MPELTRQIRDRRVAIARDVLKQLAREDLPLRASTGNYLVGNYPEPEPAYAAADLRDHADAVQKHCDVCLLGAALLSKARVEDGVQLNHISCRDGQRRYFRLGRWGTYSTLIDVFDAWTMGLMETAFERENMTRWQPEGVSEATAHDQRMAALRLGDRAGGPEDRIAAVMNNLIANDGEFLP